MQIYVVSAGAKHWITVEIDNSSSTIENVKKVIKNREEVPMDELDLVFQGTILEEGKTVSYYNIQDGSTLNMAFQLRGETVQVILQELSHTWTTEIGESDTVEDLKNKIQDLRGIPPYELVLFFFAERLEEGVILDQMRLIQSRLLESGDQMRLIQRKILEFGDQDTIAGMYKYNARPTIYMVFRLRGGGNVVHHPVKWADGSSSPPKRSSTAIKIVKYVDTGCKSNSLKPDASQGVLDAGPPLQTHDASDDNVMDSNDHASRSSGSSSMNRHVSSEKGKRLSFDEEFNSKLNLLAEVDKEVANSLKGDDWDRLTSSLRVVPNISRKKVLDAVDLFEEKPTLIRIFLSLNPQEKEEWLVRKLGY